MIKVGEASLALRVALLTPLSLLKILTRVVILPILVGQSAFMVFQGGLFSYLPSYLSPRAALALNQYD